jgi:hypothetical protein
VLAECFGKTCLHVLGERRAILHWHLAELMVGPAIDRDGLDPDAPIFRPVDILIIEERNFPRTIIWIRLEIGGRRKVVIGRGLRAGAGAGAGGEGEARAEGKAI